MAKANTLSSLRNSGPLRVIGGLSPQVRLDDWPYWVFSMTEYAVYTLCLAYLPRLMSYAPLFLSTLVGRLGMDAVIDSSGFGEQYAPFRGARFAGIVLVFGGYVLSILGVLLSSVDLVADPTSLQVVAVTLYLCQSCCGTWCDRHLSRASA